MSVSSLSLTYVSLSKFTVLRGENQGPKGSCDRENTRGRKSHDTIHLKCKLFSLSFTYVCLSKFTVLRGDRGPVVVVRGKIEEF